MEKKKFLSTIREMSVAIFIPFIIVLFIEFIQKLELQPFFDKNAFFMPVYASIIAVCSYIWIRKGIALSFFAVVIFAVLIAVFNRGEDSFVFSCVFYFSSILFLAFFSTLTFTIGKVIGKHRSSYYAYITQFFSGICIFIFGTLMLQLTRSLFDAQTSVVQSTICGIRQGLLLGSGVIIAIIMLPQGKS